MNTAGQALQNVSDAHIRYLEATYHLNNARLIAERRALLADQDTIMAEPWLEGVPTYAKSDEFEKLGLQVPGLAEVLTDFANHDLGVYNPPYVHQARALQEFFNNRKDVVVSTGTGSGKTEVFLYSILGHLLSEANRGRTVQHRGIRALILYPMNALVSDQLTRLRRFLGKARAAAALQQRFDRVVQFGMYTGRTLYHGVFDADKNSRRVRPIIDGYRNLRGTPLYDELAARGRIPAKDLDGFASGRSWDRFRTGPSDVELFTRQEMLTPGTATQPEPRNVNPHGGTPDVLVTNYSMLEYTLLRPIEQSLWDDTRAWLAADGDNQLLIVLDEAHLYRGAQGAEISLLLSRLASHLNVSRGRLRFILTSASLGNPQDSNETARRFAADLTMTEPDRFQLVVGELAPIPEGHTVPAVANTTLAAMPARPTFDAVQALAAVVGWPAPPAADGELSRYVAHQLDQAGWMPNLRRAVSAGPKPLQELASQLLDSPDANAVLGLATLASFARNANDEPILPLKLHVMLRGLQGVFVCINGSCPGRRSTLPGPGGKTFAAPRARCDVCNSRVFELWSDRDCGAAYIRAFESTNRDLAKPSFLWSQPAQVEDPTMPRPTEIVLLAESPKGGIQPEADRLWLGCMTGLLAEHQEDLPGEATLPVWRVEQRPGNRFVHCRSCDQATGGPQDEAPFGSIMDLQTKGEAPFANIVKAVFEQQPARWGTDEAIRRALPNRGRKVLCFADSRQKAARLARDLQRSMERDAFREILALAIKNANESFGTEANLRHYLVGIMEVAGRYGFSLFDGRDRDEFQRLMKAYAELTQFNSTEDLVAEEWEALRQSIPSALDAAFLRSLCDRHFSIEGTLVGAVEPRPETLHRIEQILDQKGSTLPRSLVEPLVRDLIVRALTKCALDPGVDNQRRRRVGRAFQYQADQDFGLADNRVFPSELRRNRDDLEVQHLVDLATTCRQARLIMPGPGGLNFLNPTKLRIKLTREDEPWFRCNVCSRPTPFAFENRCASFRCSGQVERVTADDPALAARKDLFRQPALSVQQGQRTPYTLRAEEHTAQLSAYQEGEAHDRAERYELLFQDILVPEESDATPQAIDVLSCTTTMEVGIDIGSLTAVALRTVPPRADNYQQRAGRAGRRGDSLAMVVTFADLAPYEQYVFHRPQTILRPDPQAPVLHTSNRKIVERHMFASIIQHFFHRTVKPGESWYQLQQRDTNLFESLGTLESFFRPTGPHEFDFPSFKDWVQKSVLDDAAEIHGKLRELLPSRGIWSSSEARTAFVTDSARELVHRLEQMSHGPLTHPDGNPINLIEGLIRANLRPAFGFPLDLCTFSVMGKLSPDDQALVRQYEPQTDLAVALTEYAPGRVITIDKRDWLSHGLRISFPANPAAPARTIPWDVLKLMVQCQACESVLSTDASPGEIVQCEACSSADVREYPWLRPEGFAPPVERQSVLEATPEQRDAAMATPAKLPTPDLRDEASATASRKIGSRTIAFHAANQPLVVSNLGIENRGYRICKDCGAFHEDAPGDHLRPFPIPYHVRGLQNRCTSREYAQGIALAHRFATDILMVRIRAGDELNYQPHQPWFRAAATTLAEALGLAAIRTLKLERREVSSGWRPLLRTSGGVTERFVDLYVFDATPGGAGFASQCYESVEEVLDEASRILTQCDCERSCNHCILTYDNKHQEHLLDRHLGLALLNYVRGDPPAVTADESQRLIEALYGLVKQRVPTAVLSRDGATWVFAANGRSVRYAVRGALHWNNVESDLDATDFQLRVDPPAHADNLSGLLEGW